MRRFFAAALAWATPTVVVAQQTEERTVQVTVTSVSARSIFLDQGRNAGLTVGAIVQLFPPGVASLEVEVRAVSNTSARAVLPPDLPPPPIGTRGEVHVEVAATGGAPPGPAVGPVSRTVPDHPPWERNEPTRDAEQPLLVPTFGQRPDERPAELDGRLFAIGQWTRDNGGDRSSDYLLGRFGVRADATNWLGAAERIRFAGEFDERRVMVPDRPDQSDSSGRIDLLSVALGTEQWAPTGFEVGRFYSSVLPEIGLVDGAEVVRRYQNGLRFGGGVGAYPRPFPSRMTTDDMGAHAFVDFTANAQRTFAATLGFQKTWHRGAPDRDLVLVRLEGRPATGVSLFGSAKVDIYTSGDTIKGSGPELTEAFGTARWDGRNAGTGLSLTHFSWPELKRAEYQNLPVELVQNGEVERASWSGWVRPWNPVRGRLRFDTWRDQDRDGTSVTFDGDVRDVIGDGSSLLVSVFRSDGGFSSGPGARVLLRAPLAGGAWRAGYRWHRYELQGLVTGAETYTRQSAELGLGLPVSDNGDLDAVIEHWFGDRENAWSLGIYVQWRF
ncbi:MAG: hypothetical protein KDE27_27855 [Planctomycetes bacterium]|nr:hypothetical protein [Planctomycetota bacterium]